MLITTLQRSIRRASSELPRLAAMTGANWKILWSLYVKRWSRPRPYTLTPRRFYSSTDGSHSTSHGRSDGPHGRQSSLASRQHRKARREHMRGEGTFQCVWATNQGITEKPGLVPLDKLSEPVH